MASAEVDRNAGITLFYSEGLDVAALMKRLYPDLQGRGATMNDYQTKLKAINAIIRAAGRLQETADAPSPSLLS